MVRPASLAATAPPVRPGGMSVLGMLKALCLGNSERLRTGRNALTVFLVRAASAGILYLTQVALARWMGAYEYGTYVFVWTWVLVLSNLSNLGLSTAVLRLLPQHRERGEDDALRGLLLGSRLIVVSVAAFVAATGLALLWTFGDMLGSHYALPTYLALVCIPLCTLTDIQDGLARARGWMISGLLPPYVLRPLLLLAFMSAAHLYGLPETAETAVGAAILASLAAVLVQTALLHRQFGRELPAGPCRYEFASWLKAAFPFWVILGCELTLQNADVLMVSAYLDPAHVGMYFAAAKTMSLVMFIHYAVGSAMANKIAALQVRGSRVELAAAVADAASWTFWPSLAGTLLILLAGKPMLSLFSPEFVQAYPVMCILALGLLVRASMGPADMVLNMLGEQAACARILVVSALLTLALNALLIPRFGMVGAASATSVALAVAAMLNSWVARRRLDLGLAIWSRHHRRVRREAPRV